MAEEESRRRTRGVKLENMSFGKLPPQAVDLEEAILGAMMLESNCIDTGISLLKEEFFYKEVHQIIFRAMTTMYSEKKPINILTVTHQLKHTSELDIVGGPFVITQMTNRIASSANFDYHSLIVKEQWAKREVIRKASQAIKECYEDTSDIFNVLDELDSGIQDARGNLIGKSDEKEWRAHVADAVNTLQTLHKSEVKLTGIPTGSAKLDRITGGWQDSDLIIVAARPAMGKSTRAANFAKAAALAGCRAALFSLEMSAYQFTRKFINEESGVNGRNLVTGNIDHLEMGKIIEAGERLTKLPFYLNDKAAINPNYLRSVCKIRKKKFGLDLIIIDYMQLMKANEFVKGRSREQEISSISGALKSLAKELNIPVIALSQLSRECEKRPNKRPQISDLRESGSLEQDADIVIALYRPSVYYRIKQNDPDYKDEKMEEINEPPYTEEDYKRLSELELLKHRNGDTKYIREMFEGHLSRFTSIDDDPINDGHVATSYSPENRTEAGQTDNMPF